jgi:glycerophosphoryl diester phosphodiesterase
MARTDFAPDWLTARPIAHRGLHDWRARVVENTLGACRAAVEGNYAIECDLQLTADGEAVLFHDDTLDRVMQETGPVKAFTVAELKRMVYRHSGEQIPTLRELLGLVDGKVPLVIELKPQWDGDMTLTQRAIDVLNGYSGPHCLMSFDPDVVEGVRLRAPEVVRGFIADRGFDPYYNLLPRERREELRTLSCLGRMRPHFLSVYLGELPWGPVETLRRMGMPVISWTIRSEEQAVIARRFTDQITFEGFRA